MESISCDFFKRLLREPGVSGYERSAQRVWHEYVETFLADIHDDFQGNCAARFQGESDFSVMLVGHIDEIGLLIKHINDKGYLHVASVGGVDPMLLPSQRVRIASRHGIVPGVVGRPAEENKDLKISDIWIDIGAKDKADALKRVEIGDPVVFGDDWLALDNQFVACRNFDNRVGCYLVAEVLRAISQQPECRISVLGVSAVQEEVGGMGAGPLANRWKPDMGIAFDVTWATDYPTTSVEKYGEISLGKGPVLIRGVRTHQRIYEQLRAVAEKHGVPWQLETETGRTHTDADAISQQHGGIPASVVSVPCRYMHSSCEVINLEDVDNIVKLMVAYLSELDPVSALQY